MTYVLFLDEGRGFQRPESAKAFNAIADVSAGVSNALATATTTPLAPSINVPVGADDAARLAEALSAQD